MVQTNTRATLSHDMDLFLPGFSGRWEESLNWRSDTNCMGLALFLSKLQETQVQIDLQTSSSKYKKLQLVEAIYPGTILSWEDHPGFGETGKRVADPEIVHMAIVKDLASPITICHRPGNNRYACTDTVEAADKIDLLDRHPPDYILCAYSSPRLRRALRSLPHIEPVLLRDVRHQIEVSRQNFLAQNS